MLKLATESRGRSPDFDWRGYDQSNERNENDSKMGLIETSEGLKFYADSYDQQVSLPQWR